jgi:hypothetical protein
MNEPQIMNELQILWKMEDDTVKYYKAKIIKKDDKHIHIKYDDDPDKIYIIPQTYFNERHTIKDTNGLQTILTEKEYKEKYRIPFGAVRGLAFAGTEGKKSRNKTMKSHIKKRQTKHKQIKKGISKKNKMNKRISKKRKIGGSGSGKFTINDITHEMLNAAEKRRSARLHMKNPLMDHQSWGQAWQKKAMKEIEHRRKMRRKMRGNNSTDPSTRPHPVAKQFSEMELRQLAAYYAAEAQARANERAMDLTCLPPISENAEMAHTIPNQYNNLDQYNKMDLDILDELAEGGN